MGAVPKQGEDVIVGQGRFLKAEQRAEHAPDVLPVVFVLLLHTEQPRLPPFCRSSLTQKLRGCRCSPRCANSDSSRNCSDPAVPGASRAAAVPAGKAPGLVGSVFPSCLLSSNFFFCSFLPFDKAVKTHHVLILYNLLYKFSLQIAT